MTVHGDIHGHRHGHRHEQHHDMNNHDYMHGHVHGQPWSTHVAHYGQPCACPWSTMNTAMDIAMDNHGQSRTPWATVDMSLDSHGPPCTCPRLPMGLSIVVHGDDHGALRLTMDIATKTPNNVHSPMLVFKAGGSWVLDPRMISKWRTKAICSGCVVPKRRFLCFRKSC